MGQSLRGDLEALRSEVGTFRDSGASVRGKAAEFRAELEKEGKVGGADTKAKCIGISILPDVCRGFDSLDQVVEVLQEFGSRLGQAADSLQTGDMTKSHQVAAAGGPSSAVAQPETLPSTPESYSMQVSDLWPGGGAPRWRSPDETMPTPISRTLTARNCSSSLISTGSARTRTRLG